jgi:hypothetical protein
VLLSLVMAFEQMIPEMAKATIVAGSAATAIDMWESQYCFAPDAMLMTVIAKC